MNRPVTAAEQSAVPLEGDAPPDAGRSRLGRPILRIHLFGTMRATTYLGESVLPRTREARAVLGCLCLAGGVPVARARLAELIWDRLPAASGRTHLRRALGQITAALGPLAAELVCADRMTIRLDTALCWIDALALANVTPSAFDWLRGDLATLCPGELLEAVDGTSPSFDTWLRSERSRLGSQATLRALRDGGLLASQDGAPGAREHGVGSTRLRVGVLPFLGSRSSNEANLAFSLSQEIAGALARFRWFDVIAPVSLMRRPPLGGSNEERGTHKELDYIVDGALTGDGKQFQITVRLLDLTEYTRPVWSDRLELSVGQLHRLDEMVTARIVARIDPVILFIEGRQKRREHYGATGLLLLAMPLIYSMEREKFDEAGHLIARALEMDPNDAMAMAWAAYWQLWRVGQGWTRDVETALVAAQDLCLRAIRIDPDNAEALGIYAHICAWKKDFDAALQYFDRSLRVNPNLAYIWVLSALAYCYVGEPNLALKRLDRYRDLAPSDPYACFFENARTIALTFKGDYERAVAIGRRAVKANPDFVNGYKPLIASLGHLGQAAEAKPYIEKLLTLEPHFTVERFGRNYPFKLARDRDHYLLGLRLAGVPEA